jgi:tetratricopeptide (TPR) repeat protein
MKAKLFYIVVVTFLIVICGSCSEKKAFAGIIEVENESLILSEEALADYSNRRIKDVPRYGEDSIECLRNLSLYTEYYRQRNFKMAYEPWRWAFLNCPASTMNIYIHGAALLKQMYQMETDPIKSDALVDTLMMVYDRRLEYFGHDPRSREGLVLGHKVVDLFQLRPNAAQEHYDISERSIQLEAENSQAAVLVINLQSTIRLAEAGLMDQTEIVEKYDRAMDIIEHNMRHNPADSTFFITARNNVELMFEPYASCNNLVRVFKPRFERNPDDIELLERITSMLNRAGCTEDELFYEATNRLHNIQPTGQSAFLMGRMEQTRQNFNRALDFFQQSVDLTEDPQDQFTAYLLMSSIAYQQQRRFPQARAYALRAAEIRPEDGRPHILIAEMYAASARECGDNDLTQRTAFWVAVDRLMHARSVDSDPTVRERANQLINNYIQHFPNVETIFFHGLSEGDRYRVECWINETTTVRGRK